MGVSGLTICVPTKMRFITPQKIDLWLQPGTWRLSTPEARWLPALPTSLSLHQASQTATFQTRNGQSAVHHDDLLRVE